MTDTDQEDAAEIWDGAPGDRRRVALMVTGAVLVVAGLAAGLGLGLSGSSSGGPLGPEGVALQQVPDLASADSTASGAAVDGITCRTASQQVVKYHVHILVDVYVNGHRMRIPAGAGIAAPRLLEHFPAGSFYDNSVNGCLYWIHVHTADGVIHIEAPAPGNYTLGQFFDIWQQPLSVDQVGPAKGPVTAFINGRQVAGDPRQIPLHPHSVIQLDVGSPVVAFQPARFKVSGLCGAGTSGCAAGG